MYAEPKPRGFGFSDTAFRVFILMASRRLESDRFFTNDYRPEVYTQVGFDWVESNTMQSLLLRHFPDLEPALQGVANPFAPWKAVGGGAHG
jgi:Animal haem peroxidase